MRTRRAFALPAIAFFLAGWGGAWAQPDHGYELSVSADSTLPFVNVAAPTGELRRLYLWLTCTQGSGMSALEADVVTSLPVHGFTTVNDCANVGLPEALLMSVPGCPSGSGVNHLLGYWTVTDTGGAVCLRRSTASDWMVAVDCDKPAAWEMVVTGYTSELSGPPCRVGKDGCDMPAPAAATFTGIASLAGSLVGRGGWSPTGPVLAYNGEGGLHVYDAASPGASPRRVHEEDGSWVVWSPDGTWLLARGSGIVALPVDGSGAPREVLKGKDVRAVHWGSDGFLHWWDGKGVRRAADSPAAETADSAWPPRSELVSAGDPTAGQQAIRWVHSGPTGITERQLDALEAGTRATVRGAFPGGALYLATVTGGPGGGDARDAVLDLRGSRALEFPDDGIRRLSVSSDGRFLLGARLAQGGAEGRHLFLTAADDAGWRLPLEGASASPRAELSHAGHLLAYEEPGTGRIHVGSVALAYE